METVNLKVYRDRKNGHVSLECLHDSFGKWIESGELADAIIIYQLKNGDIRIGNTAQQLSRALGVLRIAEELFLGM